MNTDRGAPRAQGKRSTSRAVHITVVLQPGLQDSEEASRLVNEALALEDRSTLEVLSFIGEAEPAAIAADLCDRLVHQDSHRRLVLMHAGPESEVILALAAARLATGQAAVAHLGRCTSLHIEGNAVIAKRAAFGGRVDLTLRSEADVTCAAVRPRSNLLVAAPTVHITEIALHQPAPYPVESQPVAAGLPRVEGAALVVSGGRGLGGQEGFGWLARIAAALDAGLGGSLPAVDAGWVPVAHQVGQSGKFVAPKLYFAVGISGTPQHLAGISPETRIVALNADRDAAIFAHCDVGIEADWRDILPLLAQELERENPLRS